MENNKNDLFWHVFLEDTKPSCQITLRGPFTWEITSSPESGYIVLLLLSASGLLRAWRLDFLVDESQRVNSLPLVPVRSDRLPAKSVSFSKALVNCCSNFNGHVSLCLGPDLHLDT